MEENLEKKKALSPQFNRQIIRSNTPYNLALKRLRATRIVQDRISGMTLKDIAKKYRRNVDTVKKDLQYATENGLVDQMEDRILNELVPLAIDTYKLKMKRDEDAFVAKDVLTNLARLSDKQERKRQNDNTHTLEAYLKIRSTKPTSGQIEHLSQHLKSITSGNAEESSTEVLQADVAAHTPTITELTPEQVEDPQG